ncbi:quinone oxidoreductase family protein [Castellaniella sp.]|uniref:quinone oxidoreductase family protein n=1 Tax=Castellaniella sp. TaxID=1955812 RepID=UPI002AFFCCF0|nr:quinone oxidoreductase [Castellaniella sp.]
MDRKIQIADTGGIDRLHVSADAPAEPGPGQVRIRHEAIGVSFIDIYHRTGLYPLPLPATLGVEGAGVVEAIGPGVTRLSPGDRVAYAGAPVGAYASTRLLPEARAVLLPDDIPAQAAAASMLRGITAHMLLTRTFPVAPGNTVLVHAAAGGTGALLTRWARHLGATVIGTASTEEKAGLARQAGADHVIIGRDADLVGEVRNLTDGRGVDVAYDGIGGGMLARTLACVRPFGTVASIGQAAGPIPLLDLEDIGPRRSLSLARPSFMAYASDPPTYRTAAAAVLSMMRQGIGGTVGAIYTLEDAAQAHADLEAGRSTGSVLLVP